MDARRAVELSIQRRPESLLRILTAARHRRHSRQPAVPRIASPTPAFSPTDFLQQLEAAELAGATTEALLRLAKEYEDRARTADEDHHRHRHGRRLVLASAIIIYAIFSLFYHVLLSTPSRMPWMSEPGNF